MQAQIGICACGMSFRLKSEAHADVWPHSNGDCCRATAVARILGF